MKSLITCAAISVLSVAMSTGTLAAGRGGSTGAMQNSTAAATHKGQPTTLGPSHATGQPNKSCETTPNTPGNSASAPGSAFNPSGKAGSVYAGEQPQNSRNSVSVSQYDTACARPSK
jgi:hypothetical protein